MIDTVKIRINNPQISPDIYDSFEPSAKDLFEPPYAIFKGYTTRKLNPSKEDEFYGIYLPRITLYKAIRKGGYAMWLDIEFSAPKILFGNNFEELTNEDFIPLCCKLSEKLDYMGLKLSPTEIANASVQTIHYGKNITTGYTLARDVIADISKVDIKTVEDFETKDYGNGGTSLYFHTLKHGVIFYDKKAELKQSKRKNHGLIEKDYYCQSTLLDDRAPPNPFEVVRMEARYIGRPQIKKLASNMGLDLPDDFRFADLFSSSISQKVLLYEFEKIKRGIFSFADSNTSDLAEFIQQIRLQNPTISPRTLINAIALHALSQQYSGREIRSILGFDNSQWSRFKHSVMDIKYEQRVTNGFDILEQNLISFTPVRLT